MSFTTALYRPIDEKNGRSLAAIVDIGTNGIRFSISSLHPLHARIMPILFQDRAAVSLFDSTYSGIASPYALSELYENAHAFTVGNSGTGNGGNTNNSFGLSNANPIGNNAPLTATTTNNKRYGNNVANTGTTTSINSTIGTPISVSHIGSQISSSAPLPGNRLSPPLIPLQRQSPSSGKPPIPHDIIDDVVACLLRFKNVCTQFGVPDESVQVISTEAILDAPNASEFTDQITNHTNWPVRILSKADDYKINSYALTSSFHEMSGLYMNLGGGSAQISWISNDRGCVEMSESPISVPYGAAVLTRRLNSENHDNLQNEIVTELKKVFDSLDIPAHMVKRAQSIDGFRLYFSGGGFKGFGSLLLAGQHRENHYPLQIISGFSASGADVREMVNSSDNSFTDPKKVASTVEKTFKISDKRAAQMPAVMFLIKCIWNAFPPISKILFCQAAVREGLLYASLPPSIQTQDPLLVVSSPYASPSAPAYVQALLEACPLSLLPSLLRARILPALVNMSLYHTSHAKEVQPKAALVVAATGPLAACHGLSHEVRALLGIALSERWGGDLPDKRFIDGMVRVLRFEGLAWWAAYLGRLMCILGQLYPSGFMPSDPNDRAVKFVTKVNDDNTFILSITIKQSDKVVNSMIILSRLANLEKKIRKFAREYEPKWTKKVSIELISV